MNNYKDKEIFMRKRNQELKQRFDNGEFLIHSEYYGIKCDNPECGWTDWSVTQDQYPDYIDKPCPCCGENLLTKECFEKTQKYTSFIKDLNKLLSNYASDILKTQNYASVIGNVTKEGEITNVRYVDTEEGYTYE